MVVPILCRQAPPKSLSLGGEGLALKAHSAAAETLYAGVVEGCGSKLICQPSGAILLLRFRVDILLCVVVFFGNATDVWLFIGFSGKAY